MLVNMLPITCYVLDNMRSSSNWVLDLPWTHHKLTQPRLGGSHQFSFIIYFGPIHEGYIEMVEIIKNPKMDS
jgi:hypothetical protein